MNPLQRAVVVLYGVLLLYCCLWVPWRYGTNSLMNGGDHAGYGWLWAGSRLMAPGKYRVPTKDPKAPVIEFGLNPSPPGLPKPDVALIGMRIILFTCLSLAAMLAVRNPKRQASS